NGFQYAPSTGIGGGGGSNLAGIPINAKWIAKLNGSYRLPYDVNVAATAELLDPLGAQRFTDFATMDIRLERAFKVGATKVLPSFDMFNLFNANTVMG